VKLTFVETNLMPTRDGDVVIMHDARTDTADHYVLWTAASDGQQCPLKHCRVGREGLDAAIWLAVPMAAVTIGAVFLLELDTPAWSKLSR
jgi:glycerophosphoryl diester phosphodiesterase